MFPILGGILHHTQTLAGNDPTRQQRVHQHRLIGQNGRRPNEAKQVSIMIIWGWGCARLCAKGHLARRRPPSSHVGSTEEPTTSSTEVKDFMFCTCESYGSEACFLWVWCSVCAFLIHVVGSYMLLYNIRCVALMKFLWCSMNDSLGSSLRYPLSPCCKHYANSTELSLIHISEPTRPY